MKNEIYNIIIIGATESVAGIKQCVAHTMWRCKYLLNTNCYHINLGKRQWNIDGFWRFVWKWKMEFLINSVIQCKNTGSESIKIYSKMFYQILYSIELCLSHKKKLLFSAMSLYLNIWFVAPRMLPSFIRKVNMTWKYFDEVSICFSFFEL